MSTRWMTNVLWSPNSAQTNSLIATAACSDVVASKMTAGSPSWNISQLPSIFVGWGLNMKTLLRVFSKAMKRLQAASSILHAGALSSKKSSRSLPLKTPFQRSLMTNFISVLASNCRRPSSKSRSSTVESMVSSAPVNWRNWWSRLTP